MEHFKQFDSIGGRVIFFKVKKFQQYTKMDIRCWSRERTATTKSKFLHTQETKTTPPENKF